MTTKNKINQAIEKITSHKHWGLSLLAGLSLLIISSSVWAFNLNSVETTSAQIAGYTITISPDSATIINGATQSYTAKVEYTGGIKIGYPTLSDIEWFIAPYPYDNYVKFDGGKDADSPAGITYSVIVGPNEYNNDSSSVEQSFHIKANAYGYYGTTLLATDIADLVVEPESESDYTVTISPPSPFVFDGMNQQFTAKVEFGGVEAPDSAISGIEWWIQLSDGSQQYLAGNKNETSITYSVDVDPNTYNEYGNINEVRNFTIEASAYQFGYAELETGTASLKVRPVTAFIDPESAVIDYGESETFTANINLDDSDFWNWDGGLSLAWYVDNICVLGSSPLDTTCPGEEARPKTLTYTPDTIGEFDITMEGFFFDDLVAKAHATLEVEEPYNADTLFTINSPTDGDVWYLNEQKDIEFSLNQALSFDVEVEFTLWDINRHDFLTEDLLPPITITKEDQGTQVVPWGKVGYTQYGTNLLDYLNVAQLDGLLLGLRVTRLNDSKRIGNYDSGEFSISSHILDITSPTNLDTWQVGATEKILFTLNCDVAEIVPDGETLDILPRICTKSGKCPTTTIASMVKVRNDAKKDSSHFITWEKVGYNKDGVLLDALFEGDDWKDGVYIQLYALSAEEDYYVSHYTSDDFSINSDVLAISNPQNTSTWYVGDTEDITFTLNQSAAKLLEDWPNTNTLDITAQVRGASGDWGGVIAPGLEIAKDAAEGSRHTIRWKVGYDENGELLFDDTWSWENGVYIELVASVPFPYTQIYKSETFSVQERPSVLTITNPTNTSIWRVGDTENIEFSLNYDASEFLESDTLNVTAYVHGASGGQYEKIAATLNIDKDAAKGSSYTIEWGNVGYDENGVLLFDGNWKDGVYISLQVSGGIQQLYAISSNSEIFSVPVPVLDITSPISGGNLTVGKDEHISWNVSDLIPEMDNSQLNLKLRLYYQPKDVNGNPTGELIELMDITEGLRQVDTDQINWRVGYTWAWNGIAMDWIRGWPDNVDINDRTPAFVVRGELYDSNGELLGGESYSDSFNIKLVDVEIISPASGDEWIVGEEKEIKIIVHDAVYTPINVQFRLWQIGEGFLSENLTRIESIDLNKKASQILEYGWLVGSSADEGNWAEGEETSWDGLLINPKFTIHDTDSDVPSVGPLIRYADDSDEFSIVAEPLPAVPLKGTYYSQLFPISAEDASIGLESIGQFTAGYSENVGTVNFAIKFLNEDELDIQLKGYNSQPDKDGYYSILPDSDGSLFDSVTNLVDVRFLKFRVFMSTDDWNIVKPYVETLSLTYIPVSGGDVPADEPFTITVNPMNMTAAPGDSITYYIEVIDNDSEDGMDLGTIDLVADLSAFDGDVEYEYEYGILPLAGGPLGNWALSLQIASTGLQHLDKENLTFTISGTIGDTTVVTSEPIGLYITDVEPDPDPDAQFVTINFTATLQMGETDEDPIYRPDPGFTFYIYTVDADQYKKAMTVVVPAPDGGFTITADGEYSGSVSVPIYSETKPDNPGLKPNIDYAIFAKTRQHISRRGEPATITTPNPLTSAYVIEIAFDNLLIGDIGGSYSVFGDRDDSINSNDYSIFSPLYLQPVENGFWSIADFNNDGAVNSNDIWPFSLMSEGGNYWATGDLGKILDASPVDQSPPVNQPPVAILKLVGSSTGVAPFTVTVDASDSYDPDGFGMPYANGEYITWYDYFFYGGGGTSRGTNALTTFSHTYDKPGTYSIMLRVTDSDGATDWTDTDIEITVTAT